MPDDPEWLENAEALETHLLAGRAIDLPMDQFDEHSVKKRIESQAAGMLFEQMLREERGRKYLNQSTETPDTPQWDKATEARNKWLYDECCKLTPYQKIIIRLKQKPSSWERLNNIPAIKRAASIYASRNSLPPIPRRQSGRPKK